MLFAYRDTTLHPGWPRHTGTGGEASQRLFDLNGDNQLDIVEADSSGELNVLKADGSPLASFNGGQPVRTLSLRERPPGRALLRAGRRPRARCCARRRSATSTATSSPRSWTRRASTCTPGTPTAAWSPGFPVRIDPSKSTPRAAHAREPHQARLHRLAHARRPGRRAGPRDRRAVARPARLRLERPGQPAAGLPEQAQGSRRSTGPRSSTRPPWATSPATPARRSSCPPPSSTPIPRRPARPRGPLDLAGAHPRRGHQHPRERARRQRAHVRPRGERGGPARLADQADGAVPDALPLVGPGVDHVLANVDADPLLEVIGNVATRRRGGAQRRRLGGHDLRRLARRRRARGQGARAEPLREPDRRGPRLGARGTRGR